jgi:hypothetical protein
MLFRVLMLSISVLLALGIMTQVIWPAIRGRRLFPILRGESRLARAERFRVEALERREAAAREADAVNIEMEAERIDDEVVRHLTRRKEP